MNFRINKLACVSAALVASLFSSAVLAQAPTAAQMQMFQSLPADQQQALAKQYGISMPTGGATTESYQTPNVMEPRAALGAENPMQPQVNTKVEEETLARFGLSLFAGSPTTFAPLSDVPVPADYQIGPGDEIVVQLFGKENNTHRLRVSREGVVNFPSLGPVQVAGMNFTEVRESLTQRVKEQMIGVRSDISMGEMRSMQIFVMGDAFKPGAYSVSALTTISQAVYYSGGFSESGALRNVQLKRNGQVIRSLDMYDLLLKGDTQNDVRLQAGDTVFIGTIENTVSIQGEVNREAIYEVKRGETYADLLQMAGGMTANAFGEHVLVKRAAAEGMRDVLTLDLTQGKELAKRVKNGDEIEIVKRSNELKDFVSLEGDVLHAGYVQWKRDTRISDLFTSVDSAFNSTADLTYALVVREINPQRDIRVLQFSLANAILNPASKDNIKLQSRDRVLVFNRFDGNQLNALDEKQETAKTLEEAKAQAIAEQNAQQKAIDGDEQLTTQQAKLIYQGKEVTAEQIAKIKRSTRNVLLAPVLLQLQQQSVYGSPALIAEVVGEVKNPGRYPITDKNTVKDLVVAAGGLTAEAYTLNAELARTVVNANSQRASVNITQLNIGNAVLGDVTENNTIAPRDRLNVLQQPGVKEQNTITLKGEVRFPGTYAVSKGDTLEDLIIRAGGLTEYANPQGAIFTREALRLQEEKLLQDYAADIRKETAKKTFHVDRNMGSMISDPDKTLAFVEEASKSKALGRMVVQLNEVIDGNRSADFMLEDGDFLFVPTYRNTVSVMGEVQVAITYLRDNKLDVDDYINKAGGMKKQADEDRIFVVRADGSVFKPNSGYWFGNQGEDLKAGDTIIVPLDTDYRDALSVWTAATQILYQTGVAVNALK
ncbi:SLBB domain-containing protein [Enterovibrio sp. ZSDZ42]|uniref:SLBB domain-containing protein n=1 Tax=Enterovibrio gelatinilyticus TaxID=2899819 RepID=A0ABT5R6Z6_9GAMM|nr:SLBB domain-containing protein [Enterovibrio sp. ZSDZ42]MDD1796044.1 SLBB domain-containing protein [Enterovibrio sp. ZSDZ42]